MNAGVGARGDGAEEAARASSPPLRSAAPALGSPSSLLPSATPAAGALSSQLRSAASAAGSPSPPPPSATPARGALSTLLRSAVPAAGAPLASDMSGLVAGRAVRDLCERVVERLVAGGRLDPFAFDHQFQEMISVHLARLPDSYHMYLNAGQAEDVIVHMKLLEEAMDPGCPSTHVQFLRVEEPIVDRSSNRDDVRGATSTRPGLASNVHEIVFGSAHSDRLLSQLSAVLSDVGLNVKHVDVFSTSDGFSLCAFTVEGWPTKNIVGLVEALKKSISRNMQPWSISCSSSYVDTPDSPVHSTSSSSSYATASESASISRNDTSQTITDDRIRRLRIIKMRKQAEKAKAEKMMDSFRAILSDSISFLFPAMLAIFTSNFAFHYLEKPVLIMVCSVGSLLILLNLVLSHGVEDGQGRTAVVSLLTLLTVIYVFGVFEYFLYKFFPAGDYQVTALHCIAAHFIFGVIVLSWLWSHSFKTSNMIDCVEARQ